MNNFTKEKAKNHKNSLLPLTRKEISNENREFESKPNLTNTNSLSLAPQTSNLSNLYQYNISGGRKKYNEYNKGDINTTELTLSSNFTTDENKKSSEQRKVFLIKILFFLIFIVNFGICFWFIYNSYTFKNKLPQLISNKDTFSFTHFLVNSLIGETPNNLIIYMSVSSILSIIVYIISIVITILNFLFSYSNQKDSIIDLDNQSNSNQNSDYEEYIETSNKKSLYELIGLSYEKCYSIFYILINISFILYSLYIFYLINVNDYNTSSNQQNNTHFYGVRHVHIALYILLRIIISLFLIILFTYYKIIYINYSHIGNKIKINDDFIKKAEREVKAAYQISTKSNNENEEKREGEGEMKGKKKNDSYDSFTDNIGNIGFEGVCVSSKDVIIERNIKKKEDEIEYEKKKTEIKFKYCKDELE